MRDYCEPGRFDVVVNLFGSFGYFEDPEDDRRVVANAYASLRPGVPYTAAWTGLNIIKARSGWSSLAANRLECRE